MNARAWWWWGAAGAFVILLVWKREDIVSGVRGLRNNNPGNIEKGAAWSGLALDQSSDKRFAVFSSMKYGVRAALVVFRNYQQKYGLRTIAQMIGRWAPPSENDTAAYIAAVSKRTGIASNAAIDLSNPAVAANFLRAVFRHESTVAAEAIPDSTINEGIRLA